MGQQTRMPLTVSLELQAQTRRTGSRPHIAPEEAPERLPLRAALPLHWNSRNRMRVQNLIAIALLVAAASAGQTADPALPEDHPRVAVKDRVGELASQTESVSPSRPGTRSRVQPNNFIDKHILGKAARDGVPLAPLADDATFFRRVHLDLTGRIPGGDGARRFVADTDPTKRVKLVNRLVGSVDWRDRWTYWHLDLWRTSQNRVGVPGRNLFHDYVADALLLNQPYNELVQELLVSEARSNWYVGPASYLVRWAVFADNCTEIMHEDTADEMTVMVFKHFMGMNLQCVSCHDGENHLEQVNAWLTDRTREEFWAQAAFFGNTRVLRRVELRNTQDEYRIDDNDPDRKGYSRAAESTVRVARQSEGLVPPRFILGGEQPRPGKPLRQELARILTAHPQFARATVNRFWAEFMGAGMVEPVDGFDFSRMDPDNVADGWNIQPTHPELLEELTQDFIASGYDLQHLHRRIANSSAYQLSTSYPAKWRPDYAPYFVRKFVRRLSAEQVYDAIVKATDLHIPIQIPLTDKKVSYMVQTRGPSDLWRSASIGPQLRKDLQFFAESFGQANREFNEPSRQGSIIQAALMMNSGLVKNRAKPSEGSYLAGLITDDTSDEEMVQSLFWQFLTRPPEEAELQASLALLAERGPEAGGEDLQWILMNKMEFLFHR